MSDFILNYDVLESIVQSSKSIGKEAEEYAYKLKEIVQKIGSISPSSSNLDNAQNEFNEKIQLLLKKAEEFYGFADKINSLAGKANEVDTEVEQLFKNSEKYFAYHNESLRVDGFKADILKWLLGVNDSIPFLELLARILNSNYEKQKSGKDIIKDWYQSNNADKLNFNFYSELNTTLLSTKAFLSLLGNMMEKISSHNKDDYLNKTKTKDVISTFNIKVNNDYLSGNYVIKNEKGEIVSYNWSNLTRLMLSDKTTNEEYMLLAYALITTDNIDAFKKILEICYTCTESSKTNEGMGLESQVYKYELVREKNLEKLHSTMEHIIATICVGTRSEEKLEDFDRLLESGFYERVIQYSHLMRTIISRKDNLATASQTSLFGHSTRRKTFIELNKLSSGELVMKYYKYGNATYDSHQPITITISNFVNDEIARHLTYNEFKNYLCNYFDISSSSSTVMSNETFNQIASACVDELFNVNMVVSATSSILQAGITQHINNITFKKSESIGDLGSAIAAFDLCYVSSNINNNVKNHTFTLYPSPTTQTKIDACNAAFEPRGRLAPYAEDIRRNSIGNNKVTLDYFLKNPDVIAEFYDAIMKAMEEYNIPRIEGFIE